MSQFSIPLGVITATVIGGAVYLNHHATSSSGKTTTATASATSSAPAVVASTDSSESRTTTATTTATRPEMVTRSDIATLETTKPSRKLASLSESQPPARARVSSAPAR